MRSHSRVDVSRLDAMPHVDGVTHHYVLIDGLRIHYAEAGDGPPLILLHGWPQHWWCWRHLIGPLSKRYRVICPDFRGMGWSEGSESSGFTLHRMASDVIELMDGLGIERADLVGHDWGLVVGYQACFTWPERISRFVAVGGVHLWARDNAPALLWLRPWHVYAIALLGDLASKTMGVTRSRLRAWRAHGRFTQAEVRTYMNVMNTSRSRHATRAFDRNIVLREVPHFARTYRRLRLDVPTLHLNGDHDPLVVGLPHSYRRYTDNMTLELVPSCGHFVAEEQPDWLLRRIEAFLTETARGADESTIHGATTEPRRATLTDSASSR